MQTKDFKTGWTVRTLNELGPHGGNETGVVSGTTKYYVMVRYPNFSGDWYHVPSALEVLKPRLPSISDDLRLTPQAKGILAHLKRHAAGISPAEALVAYSVSRLASCIHEIRKRAGYDVKTVVKQDDHGHKYARYSLVVH